MTSLADKEFAGSFNFSQAAFTQFDGTNGVSSSRAIIGETRVADISDCWLQRCWLAAVAYTTFRIKETITRRTTEPALKGGSDFYSKLRHSVE
jgi:hypothetical protein